MKWKLHGICESNLNNGVHVTRPGLKCLNWDANPCTKPTVSPAWYVFWDQHLAESSLKKPERLYPATGRNKCWVPSQTLGGRWGVLLRWRKDLRNQRGQQYPKITAHRINRLGLLGTQRDQGPCRDLPWVFCIYVMMELLSILVGFQTVGVWTVSGCFACLWDFLLLCWLVEPWKDGVCLVLLWLLMLFGWCPSEIFSFHRRLRWLDAKEKQFGGKIAGRRGRGNCGLEVMYEKRIKIKKKKC